MNHQLAVDHHHLVVGELENLLLYFDDSETRGHSAFGTTNCDEIQLRMAGPLLTLLQLHRVDDRGRCHRCRPMLRGRRRWFRLPCRKAPCQVLKMARFFSTAPLDEVWLRLLPRIGIRRDISNIRAILARRAATDELDNTAPAAHTQASPYGQHALRTNNITV